MSRTRKSDLQPCTPWWRVGMVWVVIGGPAVVVVAAIITAVIAIRGADPVLDTSVRAADARGGASPSNLPAIQGRNHAATPVGD